MIDRESPTSNRRGLLPHLVIVLLATAVYLNALPNDFIWDDHRTITDNFLIKRLHHVPRLFVTDVHAATVGSTGGYRPLLMATLAVDYAIFGPRPWAFRLINVALHAGVSLLVFALLRRLLGGKVAVPFIAAILFAVHPVHGEAVVMVTGRAEPLAVGLLLGAWLIYLRGGRRALGLSLLLFFLALLSKESAAIFPFLIVAGALFRGDPLGRTARDFTLAWGVFLIYLPLRIYALGGFLAPQEHILLHGMGLLDRGRVMLPVFWEYAILSLFPVKLSLDYQFLAIPGSFSPHQVILGAIFLLASAAGTIAVCRKRSPLFLAAVFFFLPLLPASNLFPMGEILGERLLYLPSVGLCLVLALASRHGPRWVGGGAILLILASYACLAVTRNRVLADQDSAALYTVRHYPRSYKAHGDAGEYFRRIGEAEAARMHFEAAIAIQPRFRMPKVGLGVLLLDEGRLEESEAHLLRLRAEYPRAPDVRYNLGRVFVALADLDDATRLLAAARRLRERRPSPAVERGIEASDRGDKAMARGLIRQALIEEATAFFRETLVMRESLANPRMDLGVLAYLGGDIEGAVRLYQEVLDYHPFHALTLRNLGRALADLGRYTEAVEAARGAIRWGPPDAGSWALIGECRLGVDDLPGALAAFERALELDPGRRDAGMNRGLILMDMGRDSEAEATLRSVRERNPSDALAAFHHGRALQGLARKDEAVQAYRDFLELYDGPDDSLGQAARDRIHTLTR